MKIFAFIKKDILITLSYKFNIVTGIIGGVLSLMFLFFISRTFIGNMSEHLKEYNGNYFSFVLIGIAVSSFIAVGLHSFANEIRTSQVEGTLEALLSTPSSVYTILIGNSMLSFIKSFFYSIMLIALGVVFFGFHINFINVLLILLILILVFFSFLLIGMLSASFIMIYKQGNPINFIFGYSSYFFGGIVFPVSVLPKPLQFISNLLPITHANNALRKLLLSEYNYNDISGLMINLAVFILIFFPISVLAFGYSIRKAKINGSLIQY